MAVTTGHYFECISNKYFVRLVCVKDFLGVSLKIPCSLELIPCRNLMATYDSVSDRINCSSENAVISES